MKRCSALLLSRKRQINTARRYHLRPIRMAIIRQLINDMLERVWREGNPLTMLGAHKLVHPLWKTAWKFLKNPNTEFPYDLTIPILSIYLEKNYTLRTFMHPYVYSSTTYNIQDMETT